MGDYIKVVCEVCGKEVSATYLDSIELGWTVAIPECNECYEKKLCPDCSAGYDEGYEDGYEAGCKED
jgi:hypothetical protein